MDEYRDDLLEITKAIKSLGDRMALMAPGDDDRFLFMMGDQMFNPDHIVRAEFRKSGEMSGSVKIWFSSEAGLGDKPLEFKGKDGDFVWAFLRTRAEDADHMLIA